MIIRKMIVVSLFVATTALAQDNIDVINLKNGDIIKGQIIENVINDYIKVELVGGSILTYKYDDIETMRREKAATNTFGSGPRAKTNQSSATISVMRDYYNDGYKSGQSVSTGGPMMGGLAGGFFGGLIGWGVVYAVVGGGSPEPNTYELQDLDGTCKSDYREGYKQGAQKARKSSANIGGALGTLLAVTVLLNASTSTY